MKVIFTGAGPGDPELLTVKARKVLDAAACCIYAGSLVCPEILKLLPETCDRFDSAELSLDDMEKLYVEYRDKDIDVVRLHTGEPSIYGAIAEQMTRLDALDIEYEVIPGISAFQAAAASIKAELTAPEVAQAVVLTRTTGRTPLPPAQELEHFAKTNATLCIYLSAHKIDDVCKMLSTHYGADCPTAVIYKASWPEEEIFTGTLADIAQKTEGITKTAIIIVGHALGRAGTESKLYAKNFSHMFREGTDE